MKLRKLKSFSVRHYDINEIDKKEKKIWRDTSNFQKFIALSVSWTIIGGLIFFIVWISLFASNLNKVDLNGYYATQEEYACLISGGSCESCVIDDVFSCSQAINTMHSED